MDDKPAKPVPAELFELMEQQVCRQLKGFGGDHDLDHTKRVLANARSLAAFFPEADLEVLELAALLHDIARPEEDASRGKICHAQRGGELAETWLLAAGATPELAQTVKKAIQCHRFRSGKRPETLEEKILFDADKLDSLGAIGLGRSFIFAGRCGARVHNTSSEALSHDAYSHEDTAFREYLVKMRQLPEQMLTAPGRAEGRRRAELMRQFFLELNVECGFAGDNKILEK